MNYYKKFINDVFVEWRFQTDTGVPNIDNPLHESLLRKILKEKKVNSDVIKQIVKSIREKEEKFQAKVKDSDHVSTFGTKAARDAAIKKGTHVDVDSKETQKKSAGVFDKSKKEPKGGIPNFTSMTVTQLKKAGFMDSDGKISMPWKGKSLAIRMGPKTAAKYKQSLQDALANPAFDDETNAANLETMTSALEDYHNTRNPESLKTAMEAAQRLNESGVDVSISEFTPAGGNYIQVRLNGGPLFTFPAGDGQLNDEILSAAGNIGVPRRKGATDSPYRKPQELLNTDIYPPEEIGEPLQELGVGSRGQNFGKGQNARTNIGNTLKKSLDKHRPGKPGNPNSPYSEAEIKAFDEYADLASGPLDTPEQIQALNAAFVKIRQSSLAANEVHKNFGEVHAAMVLSAIHPDGDLIFPLEGNAGFHDFCMVFGDDSTGYKVVEFPVKAAGASSGVGSSWKTIAKSFIFNNTPEGQRAKERLHFLADDIGGMSSSAIDKTLRDEDNETTIKTKEILDELWDEADPELRSTFEETLSQMDPPKTWEELTTREKYGLFANRPDLQQTLYSGGVNEHVDDDETAKKSTYLYCYDDGRIEMRQNSVSCYGHTKPKRTKKLKDEIYDSGQAIMKFQAKCAPIIDHPNLKP